MMHRCTAVRTVPHKTGLRLITGWEPSLAEAIRKATEPGPARKAKA